MRDNGALVNTAIFIFLLTSSSTLIHARHVVAVHARNATPKGLMSSTAKVLGGTDSMLLFFFKSYFWQETQTKTLMPVFCFSRSVPINQDTYNLHPNE